MRYSHSLFLVSRWALFLFLLCSVSGLSQEIPVHLFDSAAEYVASYPISFSKKGSQVVLIIYVFAVDGGERDLVVESLSGTDLEGPEESEETQAMISSGEVGCLAVGQGFTYGYLSCPSAGVSTNVFFPSSIFPDSPPGEPGGYSCFSRTYRLTCSIDGFLHSVALVAVNKQPCSALICSTGMLFQ